MKSFINDLFHAVIFAVIISSPMVAYFLIYM
jgi:hypothetical protein